MWFADIYCDFAWVCERKGILGPKRIRLIGAKSRTLGIEIEFHFFGDDQCIRHLRVLMHTEDQRVAQTCLNLNIQTWVASFEVAVMMETKQTFHVEHFPESLRFAVGFGQGDADSPALGIDVTMAEQSNLNYLRIAYGMAAWSCDVSQHLFYFRRLVDNSLPLDVRWLNGYRLLEWHFVGDSAKLSKSPEWHAFVSRFDSSLAPCLRTNQKGVGLLEEARALAAHAGIDKRTDHERTRDPRNAMEKTFRVLEQMVMTVLNEHPSRNGSPVQFQAREYTE